MMELINDNRNCVHVLQFAKHMEEIDHRFVRTNGVGSGFGGILPGTAKYVKDTTGDTDRRIKLIEAQFDHWNAHSEADFENEVEDEHAEVEPHDLGREEARRGPADFSRSSRK